MDKYSNKSATHISHIDENMSFGVKDELKNYELMAGTQDCNLRILNGGGNLHKIW